MLSDLLNIEPNAAEQHLKEMFIVAIRHHTQVDDELPRHNSKYILETFNIYGHFELKNTNEQLNVETLKYSQISDSDSIVLLPNSQFLELLHKLGTSLKSMQNPMAKFAFISNFYDCNSNL